MKVLRKSKWVFDTSSGGGAGIDLLLASGGVIVLDDPSKQPQQFQYAGIGVGHAFSIPRLMRIPKLELPKIIINGHTAGGSGATKGFWSEGDVFMTEAFRGDELSIKDIEGGVIYADWSAAYLGGIGGSIMFAGINRELMLATRF